MIFQHALTLFLFSYLQVIKADPSKSSKPQLNLLDSSYLAHFSSPVIVKHPHFPHERCSLQEDSQKGIAEDDDVYTGEDGYNDDGNS